MFDDVVQYFEKALAEPILLQILLNQFGMLVCKDLQSSLTGGFKDISLTKNRLQYCTTYCQSSRYMSAHRNALQRFDANGPVPFLQDGVLLDNVTIDFCILVNDLELLAPICHLLLPEGESVIIVIRKHPSPMRRYPLCGYIVRQRRGSWAGGHMSRPRAVQILP